MTTAAPLPSRVRAAAPGKVNLALRVGSPGPDGYHPLATVFQAVSLVEEVVATPADGFELTVEGDPAGLVPTDGTNLAVRAARALARTVGVDAGVHLHLVKSVPVAGGMAGGSADAAAALVACDDLWGTGLSRDELTVIARRLGADVPFALLGQTAVGAGRGDLLSPAMTRGEFHWAFALQATGLATPQVFRAFDELRGYASTRVMHPPGDPGDEVALMQALRAGDAQALGAALHNDLEPAALALAPALAATIAAARDAGALGVVLSGSGPTVAVLARSAGHARALAAALTVAGVADRVVTAVGPVPGARVLADRPGPS